MTSDSPTAQPTSSPTLNNFVTNPGAENGLTGWTTIDAQGDSTAGWITYSDAHTGSASFLTQSSIPVSMSQNISLVALNTYVASFWVKPANAGPYSFSLSFGETFLPL